MNKIKIKTPIWATRSIGISEEVLAQGDVEIEITYKKLDGTRLYPHTYFITADRAKNYPAKKFGNTPKLHIIPISVLEIKT